MSNSGSDKRGPLKRKATPQAGEYLRFELIYNWSAGRVEIAALPAITTAFALFAWLIYLFNTPPLIMAVVCTVAAIAAWVTLPWRLKRLDRSLESKQLGLDGERAVGELLDRYKPTNSEVLHDIPIHELGAPMEDRCNIDHLIFTRAGIWVLETKTWNKSATGDPQIYVEGDRLTIDGRHVEGNPIGQVHHGISRIKQIIADETGKRQQDLPVRGSVLLPGWYVNHGLSNHEVWVLEPKAFIKCLANEPQNRLSDEDIRRYRAAVIRHIDRHRNEG